MMKRLLIVLLLLCLLLTGCQIEIVYEPNSSSYGGPVILIRPSGQGYPVSGPQDTSQYGEDTLTVHFIDVGQADCALLACGGEYMLIDGGNVEDGQKVVTYLDEQGITELDVVVCSHPHEDHLGGLPAVLAVYPTDRVLSPTRTYASEIFDDFMYYADQQKLTAEIPSPGDSFALGSAEVTVLGPVKSYAETNDTSIILKVEFGENSFLFTGDMEVTAENDMLNQGMDVSADVLKVGHHGSDTSTGYRFLYAVQPTYGVISVGEDNSYGHPHEEPLSRLNNAGVTLFRTDEMGTVIATSDGREITFTWENQRATPHNAEAILITFIGNVNSHQFHVSTCSNLPAEKNQIEFDSYEDALDAEYTPCGSCVGRKKH